MKYQAMPTKIEVIGARVNNLKNIDVDIPLHKFVAITGLSGSGKSSLAMGILYAEGARRYLDSLATYTRRRIAQVAKAEVDEVRHIPSALALRQRPNVPGVRSTVGTVTEIFNIMRLIFSRLGSAVCPNGHRLAPTIQIAQAEDLQGSEMGKITCPTCGVEFYALSAEDFAFNSSGACTRCQGLGEVEQLDESKLIPDENLTLMQGAVATWKSIPGRNWMWQVAEQAGVRSDVPYKDLTAKEKDFVLYGPEQKYPVDIPTATGRVYHLDALYENAHNAVENSRKTSKSERALQKINAFYTFTTCPRCHGHRIDPSRYDQLVAGKNIWQAEQLTLGQLEAYMAEIVASVSPEMKELATNLTNELMHQVSPLLKLGLDYLSLDRAANSLSTGELQRIQLGRTLRTETTGVLYVLDEPSVGLHPDNVAGLIEIFHELVNQGNSLVVVDHETSIISASDWIIEIGPGSGKKGGQVIASGTPAAIKANPNSLIGPYLRGDAQLEVRKLAPAKEIFAQGQVSVTVQQHFNLDNVQAAFPAQRLTAVTGFSGAGKTSLVMDSLVKALDATFKHEAVPAWVTALDNQVISQVQTVDATPVGKNQRSTVATYTNIMDELRKIYAQQVAAKKLKYTASYFSYNNEQGACPACGGTGVVSLDIQYLPDMVQTCPTCLGKRFNQTVLQVTWQGKNIAEILDYEVDQALREQIFDGQAKITRTLETLSEMGLGYLHLGESTPALSGGEAQRLKLTSQIHKRQQGTLFIFDEPTVGLHAQDVRTLIKVFDHLLAQKATIIVITHDVDLMANSDYLIDLGPRAGQAGGKIVASGVPRQLAQSQASLTAKYLASHFALYDQANK